MDKEPPMKADIEHLKLLSIFHYVVAGFAALFALFPIIHLIIGLFVLLGSLNGDEDPEARIVGIMFVAFSSVWIMIGLTFSALVALSGRFLVKRRHYTFCLVMGAVVCTFMPFGTVLGVFTIIVLIRESVKDLFEEAN